MLQDSTICYGKDIYWIRNYKKNVSPCPSHNINPEKHSQTVGLMYLKWFRQFFFLCKVKFICKTPCGRHLSSMLFRILTPHFHWQVRVIVPKVSSIIDFGFLWSIGYIIFSETHSVKGALWSSAAPAGWTIHLHTWVRTPEGKNNKFLVLIAGAGEIRFRQLSISQQSTSKQVF